MIFARGLGVPQFTDHTTAVAYLRRLAAEPENRLLMRRMMPNAPAMASDDDIIRELAWRLVRGDIHVLAMTEPPTAVGRQTGSSSSSGAAATSSSSSSGSSATAEESGASEEEKAADEPQTTGETAPMREQEPDPEEASVMPEDCDEKAQAETLAAASEAGTPLCEV
jgi:hypothetical protein